ncbi:tRNA (adenosine(37)-N6)-threonylcarbamoyltransferase complex dimerization subunit type 1 TsaB [Veillonella rodentium]|uniref:UGMP family protein n=1 Tax=Veillonella rodentium TaxID=248315 RepID=A0A239Z763_9FIRM|nr:tRNA (adenosine(37)-N6)-threonylcarbamoyltransferase complex dimerization subunit type 1 TsaB [Veillonella rodentium]SNV66424.1 UGMP family protein [Veillonella rodentium]
MWLGIETSSLVSSVALMDEERLVGELTVQAGLTHSEQLVPHIDMLLQSTQVTKDMLKGIMVSIGPGSFTGLRIGMGTAKAMAYALQIPLYGVMTMDSLARNIPYTHYTICTVVDAQKKHVYAALYHYEANRLLRTEDPFVVEAVNLINCFRDSKEKVIFIGDGIKRIEKLLDESDTNCMIADIMRRIPKASSLLLSGKELVDKNFISDPMDMVPYYIRRSEAEVLWEERHKDNPDMLSQNLSVIVTEAAGAE